MALALQRLAVHQGMTKIEAMKAAVEAMKQAVQQMRAK